MGCILCVNGHYIDLTHWDQFTHHVEYYSAFANSCVMSLWLWRSFSKPALQSGGVFELETWGLLPGRECLIRLWSGSTCWFWMYCNHTVNSHTFSLNGILIVPQHGKTGLTWIITSTKEVIFPAVSVFWLVCLQGDTEKTNEWKKCYRCMLWPSVWIVTSLFLRKSAFFCQSSMEDCSEYYNTVWAHYCCGEFKPLNCCICKQNTVQWLVN